MCTDESGDSNQHQILVFQGTHELWYHGFTHTPELSPIKFKKTHVKLPKNTPHGKLEMKGHVLGGIWHPN